jgi:hypothetical protein
MTNPISLSLSKTLFTNATVSSSFPFLVFSLNLTLTAKVNHPGVIAY